MPRFATHLRLPLLAFGALLLLVAVVAGAPHGRKPASGPAPSVAAVPVPAPAPMTHARVLPVSVRPAKSHASSAAAPVVTTVPTPTAAGSAGMRAYLDPETGTIGGPIPANGTDALDPMLSEVVAAPVMHSMADGSMMIELNGACQEYAILSIGPDGQRHLRCVQGPRGTVKNVPAAAAAQPEER